MCFDKAGGELIIFGGLSKLKARAQYAEEDYLGDLWRLAVTPSD
jgi:hypothetical protein